MERITKYQFTSECAEMHKVLDSFFNDLFEVYCKKAYDLQIKIDKYEKVSNREMNYVMDKVQEYSSWLAKESKFKEAYFVFCELNEMKHKYELQEQINEMIDSENYEQLAFFKRVGLLDKLIRSLERE